MKERLVFLLQYGCLWVGALLISMVAFARLEGEFGRQSAVENEQMEALGKTRAQSMQAALLGTGEVDASRVFPIAADSQPPGATRVKLELSLK